MKCSGWLVAALVTSFTAPVQAQRSLLIQFDAEHDLAAKEHLIGVITERYPHSAPASLRLAESTKNTDIAGWRCGAWLLSVPPIALPSSRHL